jgi:hypothetical protein
MEEEEASSWNLVPPFASRSRSSTSWLVRCTSVGARGVGSSGVGGLIQPLCLFSVLQLAPWSQVRGEDAGREGEDAGREGAGITALNRKALSCMVYEEEDT